jgi:hypothetical protein
MKRVHPRVRKKLRDLETSSFTHYKKKSAKKTVVTVFCDCEDLLCEFLPPKTTINIDKHCETLEIA